MSVAGYAEDLAEQFSLTAIVPLSPNLIWFSDVKRKYAGVFHSDHSEFFLRNSKY